MRSRLTATAEFWLTVSSLAMAVCMLVVILGVQGGFSDRIEKARVQARGDVVRICFKDIPMEGQPGKVGYKVRVFSYDEFLTVAARVTMGQEIGACTAPLIAGTTLMGPGQATRTDFTPVSCLAVTPNYFSLMGLRVDGGRVWDPLEAEEGTPVAVVGWGLRDEVDVGSSLELNLGPGAESFKRFSVLGVLAETGDAYPVSILGKEGMAGLDYTVLIPLEASKEYSLRPPVPGEQQPPSRLSLQLVVRPTPGQEAESIQEIYDILESIGHIVEATYPESQTQFVYTRFSANVSRLFLYVALISLVLSGVNLANLVLVRMLREARYIGIRRAVGATRAQTLWETVRVSLGIASIGCAIGVSVSLAAQFPLSELIGETCRVDIKAAGLGTLLLVLTAFIAALYPAWKVTRAQPVNMIRFGLLSQREGRLKYDVRSALAALGIVVGVAAITSIVAVGEGSQKEVTRYMAAVGEDVLVVREPDLSVTGVLDKRLTPEAAKQLVGMPDVAMCGWQEWGSWAVRWNEQSRDCKIVACDPDFIEIRQFELEKGRNISRQDPGEAVLGYELARSLFGSEEAIGQEVSVHGVRLTVVGVLAKRPQEILDQGYDRDDALFTLWTPAFSDSVFATVWTEREVWVKAKTGAFGHLRDHLAGWAADNQLRVTAPVGELAELRSALADLTSVLSILATSGLIIGTAGVAGYMYVRVAEDTRRTGILRAVGASRKDIAAAYLRQSFHTCLKGGVFGLGLALAFVLVISRQRSWPFQVSWEWGALALGTSALSGILAGWFPAWRAASINPIEAIRQE